MKNNIISWWKRTGDISWRMMVDKIRRTHKYMTRGAAETSAMRYLKRSGHKLGAPGSRALWRYGSGKSYAPVPAGTPPKKKTPPKKVKQSSSSKHKTHFALVLDRSSSMYAYWDSAVSAFNENIRTIQAASHGSTLTTIAFASNVSVLQQPRYVEESPPLPKHTCPGGMTALYDAVAEAVRILDTLEADEFTSYIIITITDGQENQSRLKPRQLQKIIEDKQMTDLWTFAFSLPDNLRYKRYLMKALGLNEGNIQMWEASDRGAIEMGVQTCSGLDRYMTARSVGTTSVKDFYVDLGDLDLKDVKRKLVNVRSKARVWNIEYEAPIKDIVESKGLKFTKGCAFYQLTKREKKVQPHKMIAIMSKTDRAVYVGDDARSLIGLPRMNDQYNDIKVTPGNLSNFDIFIQSTSVNRKIVRGTKMVYFPGGAPII